jgi:hypothetical protein
MPLSPRDRRALIIVGVVMVVAVAAFFLLVVKGSKSPQAGSPRGGQPIVSQPTPTPSTGPAKKQHKQVLVFSGRDPFDPAQGGGSVAATPTPSATPGG